MYLAGVCADVLAVAPDGPKAGELAVLCLVSTYLFSPNPPKESAAWADEPTKNGS